MKNENVTWYVHGLWILGTIFAFLGAMIAGNVEWVVGTTLFSYWIAIILAFALLLVAGLCWISSAANIIREEK
ncbi:MAG: hypothetical protein V1870_05820 [Candidatus Aenigmatarchaeota archaeon]